MTLLATRRLDRRFGGVHAVRGVDLDVSAGEIVGLFGPNGAGKTTLFNLIAGNYPPDSGSVMLRGKDITRLPAWQRARLGIGRTFQVTRPFPGLPDTRPSRLIPAAQRFNHDEAAAFIFAS